MVNKIGKTKTNTAPVGSKENVKKIEGRPSLDKQDGRKGRKKGIQGSMDTIKIHYTYGHSSNNNTKRHMKLGWKVGQRSLWEMMTKASYVHTQIS